MSKGETCLHLRDYVIRRGIVETTGIMRFNIDKYILNVPYDFFDVLRLIECNFTYSEFEKIKEYVDKARKIGKVVIFERCKVFLDSDLHEIFYREDKPEYEIEKLCDVEKFEKNDYSGVMFLKEKTTACSIDMIKTMECLKKIEKIKEHEK